LATLAALAEPPASLCWSAPPDAQSEFSIEDPLAFDYLSQQVGLWLFPRITTRTNRAQNYVVVLYGLHLSQLAIEEYGYRNDDDTRIQLFERWERFWALATMEFREGALERGDQDTMRGIRGAKRNWRPKGKLALDFPLISRQSELGSLGAYLSSLRSNGLVYTGTLRPTAAAEPIIRAFWGESGKSARYEAYALEAMDLKRAVLDRKFRGITLAKLGKRTRLSSLVADRRSEQQARLWKALFQDSHDQTTLPLANLRIAALAADVSGVDEFFDGVLGDAWHTSETHIKELIELAVYYRKAVAALLGAFDAIYGHVYKRGIAHRKLVVEEVFTPERLADLTSCSSALRALGGLSRFGISERRR
jgi:hypothetical protein